MGFLVGNTCENISFHHNLIISCDGRQPQLVGPGAVDFRSNWIHNWGTYACRLKEDGVSVTPFPVNLVGNIWSEGPDAARHNFYQGREIGFDAPSALQLYIDKNTSRSCPNGTEEQWNMTFDITDGSTPDEGTYRVATAHDAPSVIPRELTNYPDHDTNPRYLRRWIATHAGARLPLLDRIDQRLIREALGGNGKIPDSVSDVIDAAPWAATRVLPLPWIN